MERDTGCQDPRRSADRLTDRGFWERTWSSGAATEEGGPRWRSHADVVLWDRLLGPRLADRRGARVIEVGCAPGRNLARLARYGLDPWGLEYTAAGAARARAAIAGVGADPRQIIEADFFDEAVLAPLRSTFDVVCSFGFVEHFADPAAVVARHVALLRPGGLLVVTLPNYRGLNGALLRLLDPEVLPAHNLDAMTPAAVASFAPAALDVVFAGPYGGLDLGGLTARRGVRRAALRGLRAAQWGINRALAALPDGWSLDHAATSPYLALIGTRG